MEGLTRLGIVLLVLGAMCSVAVIFSSGCAGQAPTRSFVGSLTRKNGRGLQDELVLASILLPILSACLLLASAVSKLLGGGG